MKRLRIVGLAGALILTGCNATGAATPSSTGAPASRASVAPGTATPHIPVNDAVDLLVVRRDGGAPDRGYAVVDGGSMEELFSLPVGVASSDWRTLYAVTSSGGKTTVAAIDTDGGSVARTYDLPGAWQLPTIGMSHVPAGLAGDGRVLVLVEPSAGETAGSSGPASATTTRFAIVTTDGSAKPRVLTLPGALEYDAIDPNGSMLFVLQHDPGADPTHYVVRSVDLATGRLTEGTIVDKRNAAEAMGGYAVAQVAGDQGWVYTIYRGHEGPFIHALDTADSIAFCIDLPGPEEESESTAAAWGVSLSPTGRTLYATNGALGTVAQVDLESFTVSGTSSLARSGVVGLAKFGAGVAATGGQAAIGPDGTSLYVVGDRGIAVVRAADLASAGRIAAERSYRAVSVGTAGTLYAVDATGAVSRIDPTTGRVLASSSGASFDGIVAVIRHD